jgi:uncharacterized protein (TIGR03790 family)
MNYLVTRLSGWTKESVLGMIDRSKQADTADYSNYLVIFDDNGADYDMMSDPGSTPPYKNADGSEGAVHVFNRLGLNDIEDQASTSDFINASYVTSKGMDPNVVVGYCSHGIHAGYSSLYIINDLGFGPATHPLLPGALFMSYESYNGTIFRGNPYTHDSHGQVADWILMGGTGGIGNVFEPYSDSCGDESIIFAEYINCHRNLAEAMYKGLRRVSWVETVLGDPLCKPNFQ